MRRSLALLVVVGLAGAALLAAGAALAQDADPAPDAPAADASMAAEAVEPSGDAGVDVAAPDGGTEPSTDAAADAAPPPPPPEDAGRDAARRDAAASRTRRDPSLVGGWVRSQTAEDGRITVDDLVLAADGSWTWRISIVADQGETFEAGEPTRGPVWSTRDGSLVLTAWNAAGTAHLDAPYQIDDRSERLTVEIAGSGPALFFRYR